MNSLVCSDEVARPHEMDELLEKIWTLREQEKSDRVMLSQIASIPGAEDHLRALVEEGLVAVKGNDVVLTREGEKEAGGILRRHRLTERLFADVFETSEAVWERQACELEHKTVLTEEATNAVCAFLGHPPTCPHGRPIPQGSCCGDFQKEIKPFVIPLSEASVGEGYRIVFITPKSHMRLDRLAVLGIFPGSMIHIHQKRPSYVIRVGETDVALDPDVIRDIYVRTT